MVTRYQRAGRVATPPNRHLSAKVPRVDSANRNPEDRRWDVASGYELNFGRAAGPSLTTKVPWTGEGERNRGAEATRKDLERGRGSGSRESAGLSIAAESVNRLLAIPTRRVLEIRNATPTTLDDFDKTRCHEIFAFCSHAGSSSPEASSDCARDTHYFVLNDQSVIHQTSPFTSIPPRPAPRSSLKPRGPNRRRPERRRLQTLLSLPHGQPSHATCSHTCPFFCPSTLHEKAFVSCLPFDAYRGGLPDIKSGAGVTQCLLGEGVF